MQHGGLVVLRGTSSSDEAGAAAAARVAAAAGARAASMTDTRAAAGAAWRCITFACLDLLEVTAGETLDMPAPRIPVGAADCAGWSLCMVAMCLPM